MPPFNLIHHPWIPIRRRDGSRAIIAPGEIASGAGGDAVCELDWPRPDLNVGGLEFLIGLLFAACPPLGPQAWRDRFYTPPCREDLAAAFAPLAFAFDVDGDGTRFLQDAERFDGKRSPVEALFIDAPGENGVKRNTDLMVKRRRFERLSRGSAAMALYALQAFAPAGGSGHRTSWRGGGPLTTLVVPPSPGGEEPSLWERVWANVPDGKPLSTDDAALAFPWIAPTRRSDKGRATGIDDVHPAQAFFGMPRRIRLVFEPADTGFACDLDGRADEWMVCGYDTRPGGVNYRMSAHPLSPYYAKLGAAERLPMLAREGRATYRQWTGYRFTDASNWPAECVSTFTRRAPDLNQADESGRHDAGRIFAAGYAMKSGQSVVLDFTESEWPLARAASAADAHLLVLSADIASRALAMAIRNALFDERATVNLTASRFAAAKERFWRDTEGPFFALLNREPNEDQLGERWLIVLRRTAAAIFDDEAPAEALAVGDPKPLVDARRQLMSQFAGYGKTGRALFEALDLPVPEQGRKAKAGRAAVPEVSA